MRVALVLAGLVLLVAGCTTSPPPADDELPSDGDSAQAEATAVARNLDTPWELAFDDERLVFTERGGKIWVMEDGEPELFADLPQTVERGESGLMGLALHPDFEDEPWLYACQTARNDQGDLENRLIRIRETNGTAGETQTLLDGIDASSIHDGCRLAFGPNGHLYMTMGDASQSSRAQDVGSLNGKVLRLTETGDPAGANVRSWNPYLFTIGHRNPQGLAFHPDTQTPYISEHGPENHDEVNVIDRGDNYGWPDVRGKNTGGGDYHPAIWSSGSEGTVAPAGAAFVDAPNSSLHGSFVFATLKEAQLHVLELSGPDNRTVEDEHVILDERFGRLRAATWHDGALYLSTSNEDGRGTPAPNDDRIVRVPLPVIEDAVG